MAKNSSDKGAEDTLKVLDMIKGQGYPRPKSGKKKTDKYSEEEDLFLEDSEQPDMAKSPRSPKPSSLINPPAP